MFARSGDTDARCERGKCASPARSCSVRWRTVSLVSVSWCFHGEQGFGDMLARTRRRASSRTLEVTIASLGGIGFVPCGPATVGTLAGASLFFVLRPGLRQRAVLAAAATVAGLACVASLAVDDGPDPQYVVIDELAGVWVALIPVGVSGPSCIIGSAIFRLLDKLKPGPIGVVDRRGGAWSVMGDDLVAGLIAGVFVRLGVGLRESFR
jgi:phosphatidylglycerophosphatase A